MFEITYERSIDLGEAMNDLLSKEDALYDFTFENRYHIFHRPRREIFEYIALDQTTGLTSLVLEKKTPLDPDDFTLIIPKILNAIKYTGDQRFAGAGAFPPEELIDIIFRVIMPQYGYTLREQQLQMALSIYRGLTNKKVTLCEAEVGTGKTMAYLVAGFTAKLFDQSYCFQGYPVTITTSSIELQKSIIEKEIPALSDMLLDFGLIQKPLTAILRKGKEHYFCPKRYHEYMDTLVKYPVYYSRTIRTLRNADLLDRGLDLDPIDLSTHIKAKICANGSCYDCPRTDCCRYSKFLDTARSPYRYDFQVTNHNLFLITQKLRKDRSTRGSILPCNFCIVDEAHKLAETAADVFGAELSFTEVEEYLYSVQYGGGSTYRDRVAYRALLTKASHLNSKLLSMFAHYQFKNGEDICEVKIAMTYAMRDTIDKLEKVLRKIGNWSSLPGSSGGNTAILLLDKLAVFRKQNVNMYWLRFAKDTNTKYLCCTPTDLKIHLFRYLWSEGNTSFAMTSGTMKDDTGFSFFKEELGISSYLSDYSVSEFACDSPFDYRNHTRLYISENIPDPDMEDPEYIPAVAKEIVKLIKATHGHTAILFTSYKSLNAVYETVKDELKEYPLIKMSRSNKTAIDQFRESKNGVLMASGSMWEGVDCAGDILSSVIIVRLPFPQRSQVMEYKKNLCGSTQGFVQKYAMPQMIIKLRQGVGRLIRSESDTGILAILDGRAARYGIYRGRVLNALHKYPLVRSIDKAEAFLREVKDDAYWKGADANGHG